MSDKEFLEIMGEILDTDKDLTMDTALDTVEEWDSLSYVMFQAQMLEKVQKKMLPSDVKKAKTIGDLYALIA